MFKVTTAPSPSKRLYMSPCQSYKDCSSPAIIHLEWPTAGSLQDPAISLSPPTPPHSAWAYMPHIYCIFWMSPELTLWKEDTTDHVAAIQIVAGVKTAAARQTASFCCLNQVCTVLRKLLDTLESFHSVLQTLLRQQNKAVCLWATQWCPKYDLPFCVRPFVGGDKMAAARQIASFRCPKRGLHRRSFWML